MARTREQLVLELPYGSRADVGLRDAAASENKTLPIHRWVPWIAGFSAQFVEDAIKTYLPKSRAADHLVLDPFAGVGTTLVEALKAGHHALGFELNSFAALAARAKLRCIEVNPADLQAEADAFGAALARFEEEVDRNWAEGGDEAVSRVAQDLRIHRPLNFRSRIPFFSPPVEAKFLYALARTNILLEPEKTLFRAALGATMVSFSNYSYEPSLASRPGSGKALIENASVLAPVARKLGEMLTDIEWARQNYGYAWLNRRREVCQGSYFNSTVPARSVALVVTSPPYMNNYHYVRNTRPQLYWLGLVAGSNESREFELQSYGRFWQTVRQGPRIDLDFDNSALYERISSLRELNTHKGSYGGEGWANYVATYMNDTNRFVSVLRQQLKPGAHAVIVVGNSIIQGMEFPVDRLLAEMGEHHGLKLVDVHIVRTKRVGNSIIDSSVRNGHEDGHRAKTQLYDAAVVLRR